MYIDGLIKDLSELKEVEAIAIGGSRANQHHDALSDYDIYVYVNQGVDEDIRRNILEKYCDYLEIGNHFWELEDNCTFKDGIDLDLLWRHLDDFLDGIDAVVFKCQPSNGYTTCMWHNLLTCRIVFDQNGRLEKAKKEMDVAYPRQLQKNIIERNRKLLSGSLPSYDLQIKKAIARLDYVSMNHRVTEFLASYFDIIFALNKKTHPGEKRLIDFCEKECQLLPNDFSSHLKQLFIDLFQSPALVSDDLACIVKELDDLIEKEGI